MSLPIEVQGALTIKRSGLDMIVRGEGQVVVCDLPGYSMGWRLLMDAVRAGVLRPPLETLLHRADVRLSLRIRGRVLAEAGPGITTGRLAGLLGLDGMRFRSFKRPDVPAKAPLS